METLQDLIAFLKNQFKDGFFFTKVENPDDISNPIVKEINSLKNINENGLDAVKRSVDDMRVEMAGLIPEEKETIPDDGKREVTLKGVSLVAIKGDKGDQGVPGYTPVKFKDYFTSEEILSISRSILKSIKVPKDGKDGQNGIDGKDGITPRLGIDYPSIEQIQKLVENSVAQIPVPEDGFTPAHEWDEQGDKLRFQNPDGTWGEWSASFKINQAGGRLFWSERFTSLKDAPGSYATQAGKYVRVNSTEDGLEFATVSGGGGVSDWGEIGGTLSDQEDLQLALDAKADDADVVHKTGAEDIDGAKNILASFWNFAQNFSFFGKTRTTDGDGHQFQLSSGDAKGENQAGGGMQLSAGNADSLAVEGIGGAFSTLAGNSRGSADGGDNTQLGGSSQDGRGGHSINRGGQSNGAGVAGEGRIEGADGASGDQDGGHAGAIGGAPSGAGAWGRFYIRTQALYNAYFNNDGFTEDRNFTLPDNDGTIALLSQIPDTSLFFDRVYTVLGSSITAGSIPNTDYIYEIPDVSYVLTLENANSVGDNLYYIKNTSVGDVTIDTSSANTFDGVAAPYTLSPGESIVIHANGSTDWKILARYGSISKGVVIHGSDDTVERPSGYISIEWIGSVEPTNAIDNDTWINTA